MNILKRVKYIIKEENPQKGNGRLYDCRNEWFSDFNIMNSHIFPNFNSLPNRNIA
jgi:hypothetical protein